MANSDHWNKTAADYEKVTNRFVVNPMDSPLHVALEAGNKAYPYSSAIGILDNGTGTGNAIDTFIKFYGKDVPESAKIYASDISPGMVDILRGKQQKNMDDPVWKKMSIHVWDAAKLEGIIDSSLSHVLANFVLFSFPDPAVALREGHRVLTTGGVYMIATWTKAFMMKFWDLAYEVKPDIKDPGLFSKKWKSASDIEEDVRKTGFEVFECKEMDVPFKFEKPEDLLDLWSNPGLSVYHSQMSETQAEEWKGKILDSVRAETGDGPFTLYNHGVIMTARKI